MRTLIFSLAATTAIFAFSPSVAAQGVVAEGDTPAYQLGPQTYNSMGALGSADFAGKPVLVEFWGTQ